jgi:hypothetical protein
VSPERSLFNLNKPERCAVEMRRTVTRRLQCSSCSQDGPTTWAADLLLHIDTDNSIPIHIQQDATLHSLFYPETALHVSGGTITHHQERKQLYLQHLVFVTPLLLPAAIVEELELVLVPPTANSKLFLRCRTDR